MAEQIDIVARLHDEISRPADRIERELQDTGRAADELGDELEGVDRSSRIAKRGLRDVERSAERTARNLAEASDEAQDLQRNLDALTRATRNAGTSNDALARSLDRQSVLKRRLGRDSNFLENALNRGATAMRRSTREGGALSNGLGRLRQRLLQTVNPAQAMGMAFKALKLPLILTGVMLLSTAVSALGAAGFAAVAGLAPLVGLAAVIPALGAAAAQGMVGVKFGMDGVSDAVKVLGDATLSASEKAEKLKDTSDEVRAFAGELVHVNEHLKQTKRIAAANLLPGLTDAVRSLLPLLPVVERGLAGSNAAIGNIARRGAADLGSEAGARDIGAIMGNSTRLIQAAEPGVLALLRIVRNLMVVGGPAALRFVRWLSRSGEALDRLVQSGRDTGALMRFLKRAGDLAAAVGQVLGDVSVGLFNVGRESSALAQDMGGGIADIARSFREWTESEEGRERIRRFFSDAIPVVREVGRLILAVAAGFGSLADNQDILPVLVKLRTEALPAFLALADGISTQLGPALVDFVTAFLEFSNVLSFDPLITAANIVGELVTAVTGAIALSPGLSTFLATLITMSLTWKLLMVALRMTGMLPVIKLFGRLTKAILLSNAAAAAGKWALRGLRRAMVLTGKAAKIMWLAMTGPVGLVILAIAAVVGGLVLLYKRSETARRIMRAAFAEVAKSVIHMADIVLRVFQKVFEVLGKLPGKAGENFRKAAADTQVLRDRLDGVKKDLDDINKPRQARLSIIVSGMSDLERSQAILNSYSLNREHTARRPEGQAPVTVRTRTNFTGDRRELRFAGGPAHPGLTALTGELGPEVFVPRTGPLSVVGADSPELVRFTQPGYVIPAAGTPETVAERIPDWVYGRLSTAERPAAVPHWVDAKVPAAASTGGAAPPPATPPPSLTLNVYPQSEMDVEAAVERAYRRLRDDERDRR